MLSGLSQETIRCSQEGPVFRIMLNRPDVHNAFNGVMVQELIEVFRALENEDSVRVVVFGGEGKSFCAGADLNWMREIIDYTFDQNLEESLKISDLMEAIYILPKPTIARVHGATLGGGTGLVAACDIAIASESAFFSLSEVKIGLVPACISPYVIMRLGPSRARECFVTGRRIPGAEAAAIGLVTECVPHDEIDSRVDERVGELLKNGPHAIACAKQLVREVPGMPLSQAKEFTSRMIAGLRVHPEGQEGMGAFLEKRPPKWAGKR